MVLPLLVSFIFLVKNIFYVFNLQKRVRTKFSFTCRRVTTTLTLTRLRWVRRSASCPGAAKPAFPQPHLLSLRPLSTRSGPRSRTLARDSYGLVTALVTSLIDSTYFIAWLIIRVVIGRSCMMQSLNWILS